MEPDKNITHQFNLAGMKVGDWFLGCRNCWFQLETRTAAKLDCPNCGKTMNIYDVTEKDIEL